MEEQDMKRTAPEISIIVPVYKTEPYLRRCVDSILAQTFRDFELILVDDGSPDGCPAICDDYAAQDPRVVVIHQENGGVSKARNTGLDRAQGKYIMFCDSDDSVERDWCRELLDVIRKEPEAYCICGVNYVGFSKEPQQSLKPRMGIEEYFYVYLAQLSAYTCNKIFRKDILEENSIRFSSELYLGEDVIFNTQYLKKCSYIRYIEKKLYLYYYNSEGASNRYDAKAIEQLLTIFQARLPFIAEEHLPEYCHIWLYRFMCELKGVFDSRNSMSLTEKLSLKQKAIRSEAFQYCIDHADCSTENPTYIRLLKKGNYHLVWLFDRLVELKHKII